MNEAHIILKRMHTMKNMHNSKLIQISQTCITEI